MRQTDPEWRRITLIAEALLGPLPPTEQAWNMALVAASAQFELERIADTRHILCNAAINNDPLYEDGLEAEEAYAAWGYLKRLQIELPDGRRLGIKAPSGSLNKDEDAAAAWMFCRITPALRKLERYERRALSRRCRAFENLTAMAISPSTCKGF